MLLLLLTSPLKEREGGGGGAGRRRKGRRGSFQDESTLQQLLATTQQSKCLPKRYNKHCQNIRHWHLDLTRTHRTAQHSTHTNTHTHTHVCLYLDVEPASALLSLLMSTPAPELDSGGQRYERENGQGLQRGDPRGENLFISPLTFPSQLSRSYHKTKHIHI